MSEVNNNRGPYCGKSCPNCGRVGELQNSLKDLHTLIGDLRKKNYELHEKYGELLREQEALKTGCKNLAMSLLQEGSFYSWHEYFNEQQGRIIIIPPTINFTDVNAPQPPNFSCNRNGTATVLQLKAIIGNQEKKIRSLTEKLYSML